MNKFWNWVRNEDISDHLWHYDSNYYLDGQNDDWRHR